MLYFILVIGWLAGLTGWFHHDPETRDMCRFVGIATAVVSALVVAREWL